MAKAVKEYRTAGEFGYCALCDRVATSRVRIGQEQLPVSFCKKHRYAAWNFGEITAVDAWPGRRPGWLPSAKGVICEQRDSAKRKDTGRRLKGVITADVVAVFAAMRRRGISYARIGQENGHVKTSGPTVASYLDQYGYDRATGRRMKRDSGISRDRKRVGCAAQ